jgi:hypothetical protein
VSCVSPAGECLERGQHLVYLYIDPDRWQQQQSIVQLIVGLASTDVKNADVSVCVSLLQGKDKCRCTLCIVPLS